MTGLWLLQLHIMLSQKGKREEESEGGKGGGGLLQSAATAAYKSYAPVRPRSVRPQFGRWSVDSVRFGGIVHVTSAQRWGEGVA